jgi:hypothetical protein
MRFAKYTFLTAGIYGIIVLLPQYFLETRIGLDSPPPLTHVEFFYGFIGVAVAFQIVFILIGLDPIRYRLMILPSIVEKFSFVIAAFVLMLQERITTQMLAGAAIDAFLGVMFVIGWFKTRPSESQD